MSKKFTVAVVGATGAVGTQILECLEGRNFPVQEIKLLATASNAGDILEFHGQPVTVEEVKQDSFEGVDIALFAAGPAIASQLAPVAAGAGTVCIDCSSAWRMDADVPLIIPEVNPDALAGYRKKGIVSSPTASVVQLAVALKPLHDFAGIKRMVVSTYEAVSSTGNRAIDELRVQTGELLNGRPAKVDVYPHRIAFNCLPQVDAFNDDGYTREEQKVIDETAKVMAATIKTTATCIRVPVFYAHSASVNIETGKKLTPEKARELLKGAAGVVLVDDPAESEYPMCMDAAGQDEVFVGRIREDKSIANGLNLWVVSDNLRKGAATNAVQIAELLVEKYLQ
ncbi:aspartate-semialdehyde dehydrogenase [Geomesophilobacter sediminis]|uniref:Aspartate-semialdehyde dehydrogenase n=1 Tax=Geomesophilobacter sediminis TaxID=2798584 RepID=A0A8J7LWJ3_9BACT|nr:aspartate-semialdehyde dehydrogenase [Geomesophilobacter sediminis]MBJ6725875.1 aspartate-semialdehyde dehydrogenase [Geomesophilobacter sediminis]